MNTDLELCQEYLSKWQNEQEPQAEKRCLATALVYLLEYLISSRLRNPPSPQLQEYLTSSAPTLGPVKMPSVSSMEIGAVLTASLGATQARRLAEAILAFSNFGRDMPMSMVTSHPTSTTLQLMFTLPGESGKATDGGSGVVGPDGADECQVCGMPNQGHDNSVHVFSLGRIGPSESYAISDYEESAQTRQERAMNEY